LLLFLFPVRVCLFQQWKISERWTCYFLQNIHYPQHLSCSSPDEVYPRSSLHGIIPRTNRPPSLVRSGPGTATHVDEGGATSPGCYPLTYPGCGEMSNYSTNGPPSLFIAMGGALSIQCRTGGNAIRSGRTLTGPFLQNEPPPSPVRSGPGTTTHVEKG
jgi:hypothetical protein